METLTRNLLILFYNFYGLVSKTFSRGSHQWKIPSQIQVFYGAIKICKNLAFKSLSLLAFPCFYIECRGSFAGDVIFSSKSACNFTKNKLFSKKFLPDFLDEWCSEFLIKCGTSKGNWTQFYYANINHY